MKLKIIEKVLGNLLRRTRNRASRDQKHGIVGNFELLEIEQNPEETIAVVVVVVPSLTRLFYIPIEKKKKETRLLY